MKTGKSRARLAHSLEKRKSRAEIMRFYHVIMLEFERYRRVFRYRREHPWRAQSIISASFAAVARNADGIVIQSHFVLYGIFPYAHIFFCTALPAGIYHIVIEHEDGFRKIFLMQFDMLYYRIGTVFYIGAACRMSLAPCAERTDIHGFYILFAGKFPACLREKTL